MQLKCRAMMPNPGNARKPFRNRQLHGASQFADGAGVA
jgi:hypothetical protein